MFYSVLGVVFSVYYLMSVLTVCLQLIYHWKSHCTVENNNFLESAIFYIAQAEIL